MFPLGSERHAEVPLHPSGQNGVPAREGQDDARETPGQSHQETRVTDNRTFHATSQPNIKNTEHETIIPMLVLMTHSMTHICTGRTTARS